MRVISYECYYCGVPVHVAERAGEFLDPLLDTCAWADDGENFVCSERTGWANRHQPR